MRSSAKPASRRWGLLSACAALPLLLPACSWENGNFTILGYSTAPNYDCNIHTVRVPIFKNKTFRQGVEFELTQAVITAIERYTPYKVVNNDTEPADTELLGTLVTYNKQVTLAGPSNEVREAETSLQVEIVWRDLRSGEYLSRPSRRPGEPPRPEGPGMPPIPELPGMPVVPPPPTPQGSPVIPVPNVALPPPPGVAQGAPPPPPAAPAPVVIRGTATFIPELGQSITSSQATAIERLSLQIVHLMEKGW
jgi:hypothetical protein